MLCGEVCFMYSSVYRQRLREFEGELSAKTENFKRHPKTTFVRLFDETYRASPSGSLTQPISILVIIFQNLWKLIEVMHCKRWTSFTLWVCLTSWRKLVILSNLYTQFTSLCKVSWWFQRHVDIILKLGIGHSKILARGFSMRTKIRVATKGWKLQSVPFQDFVPASECYTGRAPWSGTQGPGVSLLILRHA